MFRDIVVGAVPSCKTAFVLTVLAACNEHGKSPAHDAALGDAVLGDAQACPGLALGGRVRDFTNSTAAGPVTFTLRDGGPTVQSGADGSFALCGSANGFIADVAPPPGMLPGIAVVPVFGGSTDDLYHLLVVSQAEATSMYGQLGQPFDPAAGQLIVHQVLGELQPTLTGIGATLTGEPPTWRVGNGGAFVMFANVAPGMQRYAPAGTSGPSVLVPVEAGHITYVMSLIVPD